MGAATVSGSGFSTFYLFATALAVGTATPLLLLPVRGPGRKFFILLTLISLILYGLAFVVEGLALSWLHAGCAALLIVYNVSLPPSGGRLSTLLLFSAVVLGNGGLVLDGLSERSALPGPMVQAPLQLALAAISSSLLLGSSLVAMVLGHWYLVARGLSFHLLERAVIAACLGLALRTAAAGAAAASQGARYLALWQELGPAQFGVSHGLFLGARLLFGLLAPAGLLWMALVCVRERSNQSATGILYVEVAFVLMGEILARYLLVNAGLLV
jgi:hypothetical protein